MEITKELEQGKEQQLNLTEFNIISYLIKNM